MKEYTKPNAELVTFGNDQLNTTGASDRCNCFAERWNYDEGDWDNCTVTTGDYSEVANANSGL